jgi:anaerobic selenocysteine-containing dehydrogenase
MKIRRRDFLKLSVAAGAAATLGRPTLNAFAEDAQKTGKIGELPGKWMASTCQGCTTWCPIEIFVQDGRATKVRGNQLSKANNGYCCVRGHMIIQQIYDPDRIKVPMKRTNPVKGRGVDPKFVPITWDEALNTIADKIMELRANKETHKYLLMRGRYSYNNDLLYGNLTKMIGSPNNISHSAICAEVEKMGSLLHRGLLGLPRLRSGQHEVPHRLGLRPALLQPADPQRHQQVRQPARPGHRGRHRSPDDQHRGQGEQWLPIKPGEDGALAAAMAHVILTEGLWNKEFCGDFKDGKNLFKAGKDRGRGGL